MIPFNWIHDRVNRLNVSDYDDSKYWHILLWPDRDGSMAIHLNDGTSDSVEQFKIALG